MHIRPYAETRAEFPSQSREAPGALQSILRNDRNQLRAVVNKLVRRYKGVRQKYDLPDTISESLEKETRMWNENRYSTCIKTQPPYVVLIKTYM